MNSTNEVKQVIVIRKDLKMPLGKCCAQVAHASMTVILDKMYVSPVSLTDSIKSTIIWT